jgi:hypothetical protein
MLMAIFELTEMEMKREGPSLRIDYVQTSVNAILTNQRNHNS